ncbi:MAG TPA: hypothetical protein VLO11_09490 [Luteolibacter sp.]|nr:hypothetical protein [Luteolibacter sp.]
MSRLSANSLTTASLLGAGVLAWAFAGRPLIADRELAPPHNPLGINGSPYGEVIAMAMQGPIDTRFTIGMFGGSGQPHEDGSSSSFRARETAAAESTEEVETTDGPQTHKRSLQARWNSLLGSLAQAAETRTNPKPPSEALKRHLRRDAEDKLRFAYNLDPSHYANYNALHFFLTEPQVGTRPELTPSAAKLAQDTIDYCLKQQDDPRPALTAAAACTNILHLMFADLRHSETPKYSPDQMRQCLALLDHCLQRYDAIAAQWDQNKQWELLSPMRIAECDERFRFITKIRDAAEEAIANFEAKPHPVQVAN